MSKPKIHCVVVDHDVEVTASLDAALRSADVAVALDSVASSQQLLPLLQEQHPHLLFCPQAAKTPITVGMLETVQHYSPDTVLVWLSSEQWQGLTTWLNGVESCTLPLNELNRFHHYIDFLLRYAALKHDFRQCKHLLGIAELRSHWLVDYSWEAIAYVSQGMHLHANPAYLTLFGFEDIAEARSMPLAQLVAVAERPAVESLANLADAHTQASERLLATLRTLNGEKFRAEIRFIPAVLKGKRCTQLYVRPVERHIGKSVPLWKDNPWEHKIPTVQPLPAVEVATQALLGMRIIFHKLHRLKEKLPALYVAEPVVQQTGQVRLDYAALLHQPDIAANRFRLDYWVIEQVVLKLSSQTVEASDYLVFVSVTDAILNNAEQLRQLISLLDAAPAIAKRLVIAIPYQANPSDYQSLKKLQTLLRGVGAWLAIDNWVLDANGLQLLQTVKPVLVRFAPSVLASALKKKQLSALCSVIKRLVENQCRVIISGIMNEAAFRAAYATAANYAQGSYIAQ